MKGLVFGVYAAVLLLGGFAAGEAYGHSGGLNSKGCHAGSQPYHCHRAPGDSSSSGSSGGVLWDKDCADFGSWREAQDFYRASGPGDPHGLDRDRDGVACEALR